MQYNTDRIRKDGKNVINGDLLVSSTALTIMSDDESDDDCEEGCFFVVIDKIVTSEDSIFGRKLSAVRLLRQESGNFSLWPVDYLQNNFKKLKF